VIDLTAVKLMTFDCYGTLIDWETGITDLVRPWLARMSTASSPDLVLSAFALMQAKHQQVRPALAYPEVLRRTWRDIEGTFGWAENADRAEAFADSVGAWPPFPDTIAALRRFAATCKLGLLSNVDNASLARTLRRLDTPFSFTITAEDVGSYKPGMRHFETMLDRAHRMGISRAEILHVAQSKHHDIAPGRELGLATVWVNRRHGRPGSGATLATAAEPDLTVLSLAELASLDGA
jgi:2-haloacid dehalogenase